jgi:hypothetical protein
VDRVEKLDRQLGLVGLQRADHVQRHTGEPVPPGGPFPGGFLHVVLAKDPVPFGQNRFDPVGRLHL